MAELQQTESAWQQPESATHPRYVDEKALRFFMSGRFAAILDAAENVVIAHGMGWDMDGVIERLRDAISE